MDSPGIEPGTSPMRMERHTPKPQAHLIDKQLHFMLHDLPRMVIHAFFSHSHCE